jgi:hypothetical protein
MWRLFHHASWVIPLLHRKSFLLIYDVAYLVNDFIRLFTPNGSADHEQIVFGNFVSFSIDA